MRKTTLKNQDFSSPETANEIGELMIQTASPATATSSLQPAPTAAAPSKKSHVSKIKPNSNAAARDPKVGCRPTGQL